MICRRFYKRIKRKNMIFKNFVVVNYHRTNMKSDSQITDMMNRINIISWKKQKHKYLTRLRRVYNSTTIGVRPKWVGMVLSRIVDSCGGDTAVTYPHPIIISLFRTSWTLSRWGIFVNYFSGQIAQPSSFQERYGQFCLSNFHFPVSLIHTTDRVWDDRRISSPSVFG